jgi:hypothetical protein
MMEQYFDELNVMFTSFLTWRCFKYYFTKEYRHVGFMPGLLGGGFSSTSQKPKPLTNDELVRIQSYARSHATLNMDETDGTLIAFYDKKERQTILRMDGGEKQHGQYINPKTNLVIIGCLGSNQKFIPAHAIKKSTDLYKMYMKLAFEKYKLEAETREVLRKQRVSDQMAQLEAAQVALAQLRNAPRVQEIDDNANPLEVIARALGMSHSLIEDIREEERDPDARDVPSDPDDDVHVSSSSPPGAAPRVGMSVDDDFFAQ